MDYSNAIAALKKSDKNLARYIDRIGDCYLVTRQDDGDLLYSLETNDANVLRSPKVKGTSIDASSRQETINSFI
jgi:hypothetical protein